MLIESLIQPSKNPSRVVRVHGHDYEFIRLAKGRFVAEVADQAHQQVLLKNPKVYREFTDALLDTSAGTLSKAPPKPADAIQPPPAKPETTTTAPAPPTGDPPPPPPPAGNADDDASKTVDEITGAAQALLSSTPQAIKKQVEKHPPGQAVLEAAVAIEKAAKAPRQHVIACLTGALSALDT